MRGFAPVQEGPRERIRWGEPCAVCGFGQYRSLHVLPDGCDKSDPPKWWHEFVPRKKAERD